MAARHAADRVTLLLCGDVMTGRGVDQILAHPGDPTLHEAWIEDARAYVALAEQASGPIPRGVDPAYPWGDALAEIDRHAPDVRIANLETSVTTSADAWPGKGIHYRMHPANVACLAAARLDLCLLANNHVLDWGRSGLLETLEVLHRAGIATAGAGRDRAEAERPAVLATRGGSRVVVASAGATSSGIPLAWSAGAHRPGVHLVEPSPRAARALAGPARAVARPGDVTIASIHWGANWGWELPPEHVGFAHDLIDAGFDLVFGHSSHHPLAIELHRDRPIVYGAGDCIDDYEGIGGYEQYRGDLVLLWFPAFDPRARALASLRAAPMRLRKLRLERAADDDRAWLAATLDRACRARGARIRIEPDGDLALDLP